GNIQGVDIVGIKNSILDTITASLNGFMTSAPSFIMNFAGGLFSSIVTICFGLVIGVYMLIDFDSINGHLLQLLPKKNRFEASLLITNISTEVRKSVNGTLLVATMVFI